MISIIMPTYNRASTISKAIQSVLEQTYEEWELLVIDDCSTDQTEEVVQKFTDPRIHYYRLEENSGACVARNKGIEEAKGDFITFLDSDNEYLNTKLERQLGLILEKNADMVCCRYKLIKYDTLREVGIFPKDYDVLNDTEYESRYKWLLAYGEQGWTDTNTLFAKCKAVKTIMFDAGLPRWQDYDFAIRFSQKYEIVFQNEVLVNSYLMKDSISVQSDKLKTAATMIYLKHAAVIETDKRLKRIWHFIIAKAEFKGKTCNRSVIRNQYKASQDWRCAVLYILASLGLRKIALKLIEKRKG